MNRVETHPSVFLKYHAQSHLNNPIHQVGVPDSYTACAMSSQGHHRSLEEIDHQRVTEAKIQKMDDKVTSRSINNWERERSLPWSRTGERDQNMSVPMYLYLLNIDIKSTICDLDQMERKACQAHKWDEALTLRLMKNKLNLTREHQLLNVVGSKFDEHARFNGMKSISERQGVIRKRDKLISNGNMFSEEAKDLWRKWDAEDEDLENNSTFTEREDMMQNLEDEWKLLADEDKDRIAHLYSKTKPDFLTEHQHQHQKTDLYPPY